MTASRATAAEGPVFAGLQVLRVEQTFRAMLANERVTAREEFLRAYDRASGRVRTGAYALTGLAGDGDVLILRASPHLEDLHAAVSLMADAGLGRHLSVAQTYLGSLASMPGPTGRFVCVVPLPEAPKAEAVPDGARMALLDGRGLGAAPFVAVLEGDDALMGRRFLEKAPAPCGPVRVGLHAEIREIVDHF